MNSIKQRLKRCKACLEGEFPRRQCSKCTLTDALGMVIETLPDNEDNENKGGVSHDKVEN